jgi:NAD+ synthase
MKSINPKMSQEEIVAFIKSSFEKSGFSKAVIALSGGIDSSLSCALLVDALGHENIFPLLLPYGKLNKQGEIDAFEVVRFLNIPERNVAKIDIQKSVDAIIEAAQDTNIIRKGNVMARVRMILLFDLARKRKALVVGTENKTEHLLGYYTRFGDEASDIEPLRGLYKTQVYELAKHLNVPERILTKKPTAGLWEGQTDENEFGFTYEDADKILYHYFEEKMSDTQIEKLLKIDKQTIKNVITFSSKNSFKHSLPYVKE